MRIARSFGAAEHYDRHAGVQRVVARELARRIAAAYRAAPPFDAHRELRVLEIGAGTGLLTEALMRELAQCGLKTAWTITDLAPEMLARAHDRLAAFEIPLLRQILDASDPQAIAGLEGPFDLICGSLVWQWLPDRAASLQALAGQLAPDGRIALSTLMAGSLFEWRQAWDGALPDWPGNAELQSEWPGPGGQWETGALAAAHDGARGFLRDLRGIGAAIGLRPPNPRALRAAIRQLDAATGGDVSYRIGYGIWRKPPRPGVFVTGTDTGVGKTLISAIVARSFADAGGPVSYWKPVQTGLAEEAGDTPTVVDLAGVPALAPAIALDAPLSPQAAARVAGVQLDVDALRLPRGDGAIVVEGAGGLLVPVDDHVMMIDLIERFGLPVVLVARSTLGTINHTLLSLEALRRRGIPIAGIVLNGAPDRANRDAIETLGRVRILDEVPTLDRVDANTVAGLTFQI